MKNKLWSLLFAILIAVMGYLMVSCAAKHTELDNRALMEWQINWADRR